MAGGTIMAVVATTPTIPWRATSMPKPKNVHLDACLLLIDHPDEWGLRRYVTKKLGLPCTDQSLNATLNKYVTYACINFTNAAATRLFAEHAVAEIKEISPRLPLRLLKRNAVVATRDAVRDIKNVNILTPFRADALVPNDVKHAILRILAGTSTLDDEFPAAPEAPPAPQSSASEDIEYVEVDGEEDKVSGEWSVNDKECPLLNFRVQPGNDGTFTLALRIRSDWVKDKEHELAKRERDLEERELAFQTKKRKFDAETTAFLKTARSIFIPDETLDE